jgi:hypothetical protein
MNNVLGCGKTLRVMRDSERDPVSAKIRVHSVQDHMGIGTPITKGIELARWYFSLSGHGVLQRTTRNRPSLKSTM